MRSQHKSFISISVAIHSLAYLYIHKLISTQVSTFALERLTHLNWSTVAKENMLPKVFSQTTLVSLTQKTVSLSLGIAEYYCIWKRNIIIYTISTTHSHTPHQHLSILYLWDIKTLNKNSIIEHIGFTSAYISIACLDKDTMIICRIR